MKEIDFKKRAASFEGDATLFANEFERLKGHSLTNFDLEMETGTPEIFLEFDDGTKVFVMPHSSTQISVTFRAPTGIDATREVILGFDSQMLGSIQNLVRRKDDEQSN